MLFPLWVRAPLWDPLASLFGKSFSNAGIKGWIKNCFSFLPSFPLGLGFRHFFPSLPLDQYSPPGASSPLPKKANASFHQLLLRAWQNINSAANGCPRNQQQEQHHYQILQMPVDVFLTNGFIDSLLQVSLCMSTRGYYRLYSCTLSCSGKWHWNCNKPGGSQLDRK